MRYLIILFFLLSSVLTAQTPVFSNVVVSDGGFNNSIGSANTSRNIVVDNSGNIYVAYSNSNEVRVAKSTNGGQSFLPSVLVVSVDSVEPEIAVNEAGVIFLAWNSSGTISLSYSTDEGVSYSSPSIIGSGSGDVHMSTFGENVYVFDQAGSNLYSNSNNGIGAFNLASTGSFFVYADVLTDQNGVVYLPTDDPNLYLFKSDDEGASVMPVTLTPPGDVYFSSYALSDGPCGTFIFVGGGADSATLGYKIDVSTGATTPITLGDNSLSSEGRTLYADNVGTVIDGYQNNSGELVINFSFNQGDTFSTPIIVASGDSHNIARNPITNDILVVYSNAGEIYVSVYDSLLKTVTIPEPTPPLSFCPGESFLLDYVLTGVFTPNTTFTVKLSDEFGSFENEIEIGNITSDASGTINCVLPNGLSSSYDYRLQIQSLDNCLQSNSVDIIIGFGSAIEGEDALCVGNLLQLSSTDDPAINTPWSSSNNNVATISSNGLLTSASIGTTVITFTNNEGCISTKEITVNEIPVIQGNQTLCEGDMTQLEASGIPNISTSWSSSNPDVATVDNSGLVTAYLQGTTLITFTNINNCSEVVTLNINPLPFINIEDSYFACINNPDDFPVIDTNLTTNTYSFQWFYNGNFLVTETDATLLATDIGEYIVIATNTLTGCEDTADTTVAFSGPPEDILITILSDVFDEYQNISVFAEGIGNFEYSIDYGFWQDSNQFLNISNGNHIVSVRDKNDCGEISDDVFIIYYPKYFTPNGDNEHEHWNIVGFENMKATISVFNRYGALLKVFKTNSIGWDGTFNGNLMPASDYWFVLDYVNERTNQPAQFKAHFALKR